MNKIHTSINKKNELLNVYNIKGNIIVECIEWLKREDYSYYICTYTCNNNYYTTKYADTKDDIKTKLEEFITTLTFAEVIK